MKKAIFAFNGDPMCFIHVILNTLDMYDKGIDVKLVIEGSATKLIKDMNQDGHPFYKNFTRIKELGIVSIL